MLVRGLPASGRDIGTEIVETKAAGRHDGVNRCSPWQLAEPPASASSTKTAEAAQGVGYTWCQHHTARGLSPGAAGGSPGMSRDRLQVHINL